RCPLTMHSLRTAPVIAFRKNLAAYCWFSTGSNGGAGLSTKRLQLLSVSHPMTSMEGVETAVEMADRVQELIDSLASLPPAGSEEDNIDRLQQLERAKRALAAAQASVTHAFVEQRQEHESRLRITTS